MFAKQNDSFLTVLPNVEGKSEKLRSAGDDVDYPGQKFLFRRFTYYLVSGGKWAEKVFPHFRAVVPKQRLRERGKLYSLRLCIYGLGVLCVSLCPRGKTMSLAQKERLPAGGEIPRGSSERREVFHRLAEVRQREGLSRRTIARRLHTTISAVKAMEEAEDLPLSQIYAWQKALRVPIGELLSEPAEPLSAPVLKRARMVRLMKTASAIFHWTRQKSIRRMAHMLMEQLVELMPELAHVGPWPIRGPRRPSRQFGAAFHRQFSLHTFNDLIRHNR